jgi:hypothetical protein
VFFVRSSADIEICQECGKNEIEHVWHCADCGAVGTHGATMLPRPGCECRRQLAFLCPAELRRVSESSLMTISYNALMQEQLVARGFQWEMDEARRLLSAQGDADPESTLAGAMERARAAFGFSSQNQTVH